MTRAQQKERIKHLWHLVRIVVRATMFITRLQKPLQNREYNKGIQSMLQTADCEDNDEAFTVWFLLHP